jgi:hypothetical protein
MVSQSTVPPINTVRSKLGSDFPTLGSVNARKHQRFLKAQLLFASTHKDHVSASPVRPSITAAVSW